MKRDAFRVENSKTTFSETCRVPALHITREPFVCVSCGRLLPRRQEWSALFEKASGQYVHLNGTLCVGQLVAA